MKSIATRRLADGLLVLAVLSSGACLLPVRAAADPPATVARPPGAAPVAPAGTVPPSGPGPTTQPAPSPPPPVLRLSRNLPGDSKPLLLTADKFASWVEKGHRVILMQGQVLIQQGLIRLRSQEAVVLVNLDRLQRQGILHADLYAEGDVFLEDGRGERRGPKACLDLNTRGELKLLAQKERVLQTPVPDSRLLHRALEELYGIQVSQPKWKRGGEEPAERRKPSGWVAPSPPSGYSPMPPSSPGTAPMPMPTPGKIRGVAPDSTPKTPPLTVPPGSRSQASPALPPGSAGGPPASNNPRPPSGPRLLTPPRGGDSPQRQYTVAPRTGATFQLKSETLPSGEQASIFTGGVIIGVRGADGSEMVDIEADNALIWSRGGITREMVENLRRPEGQTSRDLEFYFSGNVEVRQQTGDGTSVLRADEIYLDARRNVAVALSADLQFNRVPEKKPGEGASAGPRQPDPVSPNVPVHIKADELRQLAAGKYEALRAEVFASKLPSDPGLKVVFSQATIEEVRVPKTTFWGRPIVDRNGNPISELQRPVEGNNARLVVEDVPIFYLPRFKGDANDPLGPLENIRMGFSRVFGAEFGVSLDVYDLFRLQPLPDSRWTMDLDYLSYRGPALGTTFDASALTFFEMPSKSTYLIRGYGIYDDGRDNLGAGRGDLVEHPDFRGRFLYRQNVQELPEGFAFQAQVAPISDRNFLEQYYKYEFDTDVNQNTYAYIKQTQGSWAWTGLVEPRLRDWVTETEWLPRLDGYAIGYNFFDRLTYHAHASAGYGQLRLSDDQLIDTAYSPALGPPFAPLPPVSFTDQGTSTGRFDFMQEVSAPFGLGPVKLAPYAVADLAYYTQNLDGDGEGRAWGGLGLRASMPLSRLYPDVHSVLWNLNGIMHKIVFSTNYLWAESSAPFTNFAQLDRLNDDATDQALRDLRPKLLAGEINPTNGPFLATSALFDPQVYAIRRLIDNRIDTLDDIHAVQLGMRQRLQTKRGFPGRQHIVDWMTLDLTATAFPQAERDNFGRTFAFLEYDYTWNIGDRTSLLSSGWVDPIEDGPRVFTLGAYFDRPDRTRFYLGYRHIDPIESRAVTGAATYIFSPKYAMTGSSTYDFGTSESLANSLVFTRLGADLNVSLGFTYNAIQNNFGFLFEILPSLAGGGGRNRLGASAMNGHGLSR